MVTLDTLRTLHEHDHKLAAYCATCERWAVLDLERLITEGAATIASSAGSRAVATAAAWVSWQLRPPALRPGVGARAYI
jgi:hypothetical protein